MILVTGATGLLGSHLCYRLLKEGKNVVGVRRSESRLKNTAEIFSYYADEELSSKLIWEEGNILDIHSIDEIIKKHSITEIYHCAALVSFEKADVPKLHKLNIEGTANMINVALENRIEKFCHVSSIAALSQPDKQDIITENLVWKSSPHHTTYSITKYGAEREAWRGMEEGLNVVIVNPALIIGPGCWGQSSGMLISNAKRGIKVYTNGGTGLVDIRDVVNAMVILMEKNIFGQRFILSAENLMFREMLAHPLKQFGKKAPTIPISKFLFRIGYRAERIMCVFNGKKPRLSKEFVKSGFETAQYSNEKIKKQIGMTFTPIEKAFEWTCKFYPKD